MLQKTRFKSPRSGPESPVYKYWVVL